MRKRFRKITAVLLSFVIVTLIIPFGINFAGAITQSDFENKINNLRSKYYNGYQWLSSFDGAWQCCGFAYLMGNEVFGSSPRYWTRVYSMDSVKAGDVIQYGDANSAGHTVFVTNVSGNDITFVDCNGNGNITNGVWVKDKCIVKWDNHISKWAACFGYSFSYILSSPGIDLYVNLGTDFYAFIMNSQIWKPLTVERNRNVDIRSEKSDLCADQVWKFERQSDGSYKIISTANRECLDVTNAGIESGTNVTTCVDNDNDAQRWYIYGTDKNYILKSKCSDCVLDVSWGSSEDGTNIQMSTRNNSYAQIFQICQLGQREFVANLGNEFTAPIFNTKAWITLANDNNNVVLKSRDDTSNQLWRFKKQSDGSYKIYSCFDGKCIDLDNAIHNNGTNIQMCTDYPNDAQYWYLYEYYGGYTIQSKESGKFFDVCGGNLTSGTNIQSYEWNGTDSQKFSIYQGIDCQMTCPKLSYVQNENTIKLSWTNVFGKTNFILQIIDDISGNVCNELVLSSNSRNYESRLSTGRYQCKLIAKNYYEQKESNLIVIDVMPEYQIGDVNTDKSVDILDATMVQKAAVDKVVLTEAQKYAADVNDDGTVDVLDAADIQKFSVDKITEFKKKA